MHRIIGQQRALAVLRAQLASGRVHHAQIFHGPSGVGKFTTAAAFAARLLCHDPVTDLRGDTSACGVCASCKLLKNIDALADRDVGDGDDTVTGEGGEGLHLEDLLVVAIAAEDVDADEP